MSPDDDGVLPERRARTVIDAALAAAGWVVQDYKAMNVRAAQGVVVRELPTEAGPADYVMFVDRQAIGVIEAKKVGTTLTGVEWQTRKYQRSPKDELPALLVNEALSIGVGSIRNPALAYDRTFQPRTVRPAIAPRSGAS